jgi:hypothetical protein
MYEEYQIHVHHNDAYSYKVIVSESIFEVSYFEYHNESKEPRQTLSFGSIQEMEAVANAMLKTIKMLKG